MKIIRLDSKEYTPSKIICVGKNFPDHVKEMGGSALPGEPVIFLKPNSAIAFNPREVAIPESLGLLHHEVELCILAGRGGRQLTPDEAGSIACGYAVGIDFTLRERQAEAKKAQGPWALAKGFDLSAVFGEFASAGAVNDPLDLDISLSVDGALRQSGSTRDMIFSPGAIISFVSRFMTVEPGDIFMCGTPAGVGEVRDNDEIEAGIDGLPRLHFRVVRK
ncbi:MAG: fumarylacetoacetate hydrolase family protein [bacterium]